jgi:hypothetical protein
MDGVVPFSLVAFSPRSLLAPAGRGVAWVEGASEDQQTDGLDEGMVSA